LLEKLKFEGKHYNGIWKCRPLNFWNFTPLLTKEIYVKNIKNLEKGFTPETNNVMEQLFSLINDFVNQARSFKINGCLENFCYNLFISLNNRIFITGLWRGFTPLQRAKIKYV
jgi:hypothetical protein